LKRDVDNYVKRGDKSPGRRIEKPAAPSSMVSFLRTPSLASCRAWSAIEGGMSAEARSVRGQTGCRPEGSEIGARSSLWVSGSLTGSIGRHPLVQTVVMSRSKIQQRYHLFNPVESKNQIGGRSLCTGRNKKIDTMGRRCVVRSCLDEADA
jgi:hypothetical protein